MIRAAFIGFLATAATAWAGTRDDGVADDNYLRYADGFSAYTSKLESKLPDGRKCYASATLIAPRWALTAAHVVDGSEGVTLVTGTTRWPVCRIVIHRDWNDDAGRDDLAMLQSEEDFGLKFYPPLATGDEEIGDTVSICGYGVTGTLTAGHNTSDGLLRAGTNKIERFERGMIVCHARRRSSPMEFCIAPGDSGGPLFCRGALAGVNSITMRDKGPLLSREGEESGHLQVSLYREWIIGVMEEFK